MTEKNHKLVNVSKTWQPATIKSFGKAGRHGGGDWGFITLADGSDHFLHLIKVTEAESAHRPVSGDTLEVLVGQREDDGRSAVAFVRKLVPAKAKAA